MKTIKTLLLAASASLLFSTLNSCTDYQDEIDALDVRVTYLESLVNQINTDLKALGTIVKAIEDGDYITDVTRTTDGYVINFKKNGPVYIIDGVDGADAAAPNITVRQDPLTGDWFWVLDGEWLTVGGEKIRANGKDGADGAAGKDAISPKVRINPTTNEWEYSTDGGNTWTPTGTKATGTDGKDGYTFFSEVTWRNKDGKKYLILVTADDDPTDTTPPHEYWIPVLE
jgi:hypothetical protein